MDSLNHKCKYLGTFRSSICKIHMCCKVSDYFWIRNRTFLIFIATICFSLTLVFLLQKIIIKENTCLNTYHILFITSITFISCAINLLIRARMYTIPCEKYN